MNRYKEEECSHILKNIENEILREHKQPSVLLYIKKLYEIIRVNQLPMLRILGILSSLKLFGRPYNICIKLRRSLSLWGYVHEKTEGKTHIDVCRESKIEIIPIEMIKKRKNSMLYLILNRENKTLYKIGNRKDLQLYDFLLNNSKDFMMNSVPSIPYPSKNFSPNTSFVKEEVKLLYIITLIFQPDLDLNKFIEDLSNMPQEKYYDLILKFMCYIYHILDLFQHQIAFPLPDFISLYEKIRGFPDLPLYPQLEMDLIEAYGHLDYERLKEIERRLYSLNEEMIEI